jgi:O-antigen/teichoic acid export membrane protein
MMRRVAAGIGMTTFDKLVVAGTQLVLVPVLASRWGLELYGQWLLLATLPQFLSLSDLGFATAAGTRMTMAVARGDRDEALRLFQSAWRAILASSAVIVTVLMAAAWLLPAPMMGADDAERRLTFAILALYGVAAVQGGIFFAAFRAAGLFPVGAFCNAMVLLVENGALVLVVLLGGSPLAAALAWLFGRLAGLTGQNMVLRRKVPWLRIGLSRGSWAEARKLLGPAGAVMLLPLAQAVVLQGTALMVGAAAGAAAVPVFAATRTLSRVGMQMCWIVTTPLMPEFSAAVVRGDRGRMAAMVVATLAFSGLLVAPYALGFMVLGGGFVRAWTHGAILPPATLTFGMGLAILFGGIWYPLSNLLLAADRQARYTLWYAGLALASLPAAFVLVRLIGVSGAAGAMALLDGAMLLVVCAAARTVLPGWGEMRACATDRLRGAVRA